MDLDNLHTAIIELDLSLEKQLFTNKAAEIVTSWSNYPKFIEKIKAGLKEIQTSKRIELQVQGQHFNCYITKLPESILFEFTPIIYQDMKQVTHELKRPIQNIKALVETLNIGAKNDPQMLDDYLVKMNYEADRLGNMVNDLLSLSHITNGLTEANIEEHDLYLIVQRLSDSAQQRANDKDINVQNKIPKDIKIKADLKLLEHLLGNLIDNAVKYNKQQGEVIVNYTGSKILISDTGLGMGDEELSKIFDQFYRVQDHAHIKGTGLGLSIVKAIVDLHGWDIDVKSTKGLGTSFQIAII